MQKVSYMGDGSTTEFSFNFPYFENTNIIVTKNNATATGYSVVGTSGGTDADFPYTGGKIVFETAPTSLDCITIARSLPLSRVVDYQPTAKINPTTMNQDANYLMEVIKDKQDEIDTLCSQYADIADKESTTTLLARIAALSQQITDLGDISTLRQDVSTNTENISLVNIRTTGLSDYVVESQAPSADNNYTWYRKYKSGWIEQGGEATIAAQAANTILGTDVTLPVTMAGTNYLVNVCFITDGGNTMTLRNISNTRATTKLTIGTWTTIAITNSYIVTWEIKGMAE